MAFSLYLAICTIFGIFSYVSIQVQGEDNCDECTMKIESVIESMQGALQARDPITVDTVDPCTPCTFSGICTVEMNGDVCTEKHGDTCYDHKLKLKFKHINITCDCELPCNPVDVAKLALEASKNTEGAMKCAGEDEPPNPDNQMAQPSLTDILQMKECKSGAPTIGKTAPKTIKGRILGQYHDFKIDAVLRKCEEDGKVKTKNVKLDLESAKNAVVSCIGEPSYKQPCGCLAKTGFVEKLMNSFVAILFPCYGDDKMSENSDLLQELSCETL